jgi:hypothetical protein
MTIMSRIPHERLCSFQRLAVGVDELKGRVEGEK